MFTWENLGISFTSILSELKLQLGDDFMKTRTETKTSTRVEHDTQYIGIRFVLHVSLAGVVGAARG